MPSHDKITAKPSATQLEFLSTLDSSVEALHRNVAAVAHIAAILRKHEDDGAPVEQLLAWSGRAIQDGDENCGLTRYLLTQIAAKLRRDERERRAWKAQVDAA